MFTPRLDSVTYWTILWLKSFRILFQASHLLIDFRECWALSLKYPLSQFWFFSSFRPIILLFEFQGQPSPHLFNSLVSPQLEKTLLCLILALDEIQAWASEWSVIEAGTKPQGQIPLQICFFSTRVCLWATFTSAHGLLIPGSAPRQSLLVLLVNYIYLVPRSNPDQPHTRSHHVLCTSALTWLFFYLKNNFFTNFLCSDIEHLISPILHKKDAKGYASISLGKWSHQNQKKVASLHTSQPL